MSMIGMGEAPTQGAGASTGGQVGNTTALAYGTALNPDLLVVGADKGGVSTLSVRLNRITPLTPLTNGTYRVTLQGSLGNMNAQALGTDYSFTFTVDALQ